MTFTIAQTVIFRSEDGTLWSIAQPDKRVALTTIPARLFTYLLDNADKIISREELLNNIWEKYGLEPSNNSVNQYVSLIRKSLAELGCEGDILQTLPRVGFYISGDKVFCDEAKREDVKNPSVPLSAAQKTGKTSRSPRRIVVAISLMISAFFIVQHFSQALSPLDYDFPHSKLFGIGSIGACPLYSLNKSPAEVSKRKEQLALGLASSRLACVPNAVFIFQSSEQDLYQNTGRVFMTRCIKNDDTETHFSDCKAIYDFSE